MVDFSTSLASEPTTKEAILEQIIEVVSDHALDTVSPNPAPITPVSPAPPSAPEVDFVPHCVTQRPIPPVLRKSNTAAITVGLNRECPRWVPGSTLKWVGIKEGFETPENADYAAQQLKMACKKSNECDVGVKFEWIKNPAEAAFALWYGGAQGGTLASAFFPNGNDMNMIMVYNAAFATPMWKENLWKVFTHELGYVLGLRHEFAIDWNPETQTAYESSNAVILCHELPRYSHQWERLLWALLYINTSFPRSLARAPNSIQLCSIRCALLGLRDILGPRNANSVMTYKNSPPEIQKNRC